MSGGGEQVPGAGEAREPEADVEGAPVPAEETRHAALGAARDARSLLAELAPRDDLDPALIDAVPPIIAALYATEVGDSAKVLDGIESAMTRLRALLSAADSDELRRLLSRALALLHPVRLELARALGREREDGTAPFLLTPSRLKPIEPDDERRVEARRELVVEVGLEGDNAFFTGKTGDVSQSGLFVATDDPLPVGTALLLSFVLPEGAHVRAEARVAWVRAPRYRPEGPPSGMGVQLEQLRPEDAEAIARFLEARPAFHYE